MFDYRYIYSKPSNKAEFLELLNQAIQLGIELNKQLDEMTRILEVQSKVSSEKVV